jgi:hypothetical protein
MENADRERERKKKAIFNTMSPKHQQKILKKVGYENWDPFQEPKYPMDLREQEVERKAMVLSREFLEACRIDQPSDEYLQAVREIIRGLLKGQEQYRAMFEFCCWYRKSSEKKGSCCSTVQGRSATK